MMALVIMVLKITVQPTSAPTDILKVGNKLERFQLSLFIA
jgi:hypothetical protein